MLNYFQEEFYQVMTLGANSRAASIQASKDDTRVIQMINGVLISKPASTKKEPEVIHLQEYAKTKAGSVSSLGINKVKEIADFINAGNH